MTSKSDKGINPARRATILDAMLAGRLPRHAPKRTWGGSGSGMPCAVCGESVKPNQVEWELEFTSAGEGGTSGCLHVHPDCGEEWDRVRKQMP